MGEKRLYVPRRLWLTGLAAVVTLLASVGTASAQIPDDSSAVDQYVEDPPQVGGATPMGPGSGSGFELPRALRDQIAREGGDDAATLEQVASSPAYGAPQTRLARRGDSSREGSREALGVDRSEDASVTDAVGAAVSAAQGGDAGRLVGLLIALFAIAVAALAAAGLRQRRRSS